MGVVYLAEQAEPIRRRVALKVIKPGMDSAQVLARFDAERQALALMDHPNIAHVHDAGTTPAGRPYFVMERVEGVPITRYCDEARLTPRQRLELFIPVCQAIQHAHQKGIIHRDIKPSNILVTVVDGQPVPKVIDFGIAKAIDQRLTERTVFTRLGAIVGTPEYMSPEQAGASPDIDTRADVYALGVLLYELLTGTTPLDRDTLRQAAFDELLKRVREEEPPKPSTRLSGTDDRLPSVAAVRGTEPARLARLVRGDLDWVVMKALEKDRSRRYETANGLARDVQRYLDGDPVEAGPPSRAYRMRKFARKHRAALATAAAFVAVMVAATALSTWAAWRAIRAERQARSEAAKAEAINDFLTNDLLTQAAPANNAAESHVTLREVLDRAAEKVGDRLAGQPEIRDAVRTTIARTYFALGSWEGAERQFRELLESARARHGPGSVEALSAQVELARVLDHRGRMAEARELQEAAAGGLARIAGPSPDLQALRADLAEALRRDGRLAEAVAMNESILKERESTLGPGHPDTLTARDDLAMSYLDAGRFAEAVALSEATLERRGEVLGPDHPDTLISRNNLASAYNAAGRSAEAAALTEATLERMKYRLGPDHPDTLICRNNLAVTYQIAGRLAQAGAMAESALEGRERVLGADNPDTLDSLITVASIRRALGRPDEAVALYREELARRPSASGPGGLRVARTLDGLGGALMDLARWPEAEAVLRESLAIREAAAPYAWGTSHTRSLLGRALVGLGRYAEAEPLVIAGYEGLVARSATTPAPYRSRPLEAAIRVIALYEAWGKPDEVRAWKAKLGLADLPADVFAPPPEG